MNTRLVPIRHALLALLLLLATGLLLHYWMDGLMALMELVTDR